MSTRVLLAVLLLAPVAVAQNDKKYADELDAITAVEKAGVVLNKYDSNPADQKAVIRNIAPNGKNPVVYGDSFGLQVTDSKLKAVAKELAGFKSMTTVSFTNSGVTDAGLEPLAKNVNLATLNISRTGVTSAGVKALAPFKSLATLDADSTKIGDAGVETLVDNHKQLHSLDLSNTPTADGASKLITLPRLSTLNLTGSKITDKGAKEFSEFKVISTLNLSHTSVSPQSYQSFGKLSEHLAFLDLTGSRIVAAKLAGLKQSLPYTTVLP